jgi:hypothetical protein
MTMNLRRQLSDRLPLHAAFTVVLMIASAGFVRVLQEHWREGTALVGGALLVAGFARILLPDDKAGLLAVRSQAADVLCYLGFGGLMVLLAVTVQRIAVVVT